MAPGLVLIISRLVAIELRIRFLDAHLQALVQGQTVSHSGGR